MMGEQVLQGLARDLRRGLLDETGISPERPGSKVHVVLLDVPP